MPQYLVLARDGTDADAPKRRQAVRPAHFEGIKSMVENGELLLGGALLGDGEEMVGSAAIVEFAGRAELDAWLEREPYMKDGVWRSIQILPMRVAVNAGKINP